MYTWKELLEQINNEIRNMVLDRKPEKLYAPIRYVLSLGGKRIRPVLMLLAYNLYKEDVSSIYAQALAIETYHNYTLLHDDLMDKADMRRGMPTVHKKWNDNTAILSGDSMLVLAYQYMAKGESVRIKEVMDLFTETALEIGEGQQYDMDFETRNDVTEDEYIEMIRLKTSVLLACALKIGAVMADAPAEDAEALYKYGECVGLAFQLQDDYLDVYGDPAVFGKKTGGDILCNKKTYLLINACQKADSSQLADLEYWLGVREGMYNPEEKIAAVTELYNQIGIRQLCEEKIKAYFDEAEQYLNQVQLPDTRKANLRAMVMSLFNRQS